MDDMRGSKRSELSAEDHFANYISAELSLISNTLLREQAKMKIQQVLYDTKVALVSSTGIATAILPSPSITATAATFAAPRSVAVTTSAILSPSTVVYSSAAASTVPCHTRDLLLPCSTATTATKVSIFITL
jgi:hypothetical protein